jgi:SAM-dependent methyltransferase
MRAATDKKEGPVVATLHPMTAAKPDLWEIKRRQRTTWASGNYARVGNPLLLTAELLVEAVDPRAGELVLDVAAGTGNAALAAARRFCEVTATDYVTSMLAQARVRSEADGLTIDLREADAEQLPYPDASFDIVLSAFGAMFAPNHHQAADELLRVCRPGGRIGLTNWTPEGFLGDFCRAMGRHVPSPTGLRTPMLWGSESYIRELFGPHVLSLTVTRRKFVFRHLSPRDWINFFRTWYGPTLNIFESLDMASQARLAAELEVTIEQHNLATDGTMIVPAEYLEVVAVRR